MNHLVKVNVTKGCNQRLFQALMPNKKWDGTMDAICMESFWHYHEFYCTAGVFNQLLNLFHKIFEGIDKAAKQQKISLCYDVSLFIITQK